MLGNYDGFGCSLGCCLWGLVRVLGRGEAREVVGDGFLVFLSTMTVLLLFDGYKDGAADGSRTAARIGSAITSGRRTMPSDMSVLKSRMCSVIGATPRFPKKVGTYLRFLCGGVACPTRTVRDGRRNRIIVRFIIAGGNGVVSPGIIGDMSPSLSTRTVQVVGLVPS